MSASISRYRLRREGGYNLVELAIAIVILGLLIIGVVPAFVNYVKLVARNSANVEMTADSQSLLRNTVEELRYGAGVRQTNTITDANAPAGGWNTSNSNFVIVIAMPAVDSNREYIIDSITGSPYNNEFVYYKSGTTLYKRILAHPSATGNSIKTSCPESLASASCPADRKLIANLDDMVFTLYDQDDAITTDPLLARSVKINLALQKIVFGEQMELDYDIQTTLRNTF